MSSETQEMDLPISPALLRKYQETPYPGNRLDGQRVESSEGQPEVPLATLMHSICNWTANLMAWGEPYIGRLREVFPLAQVDSPLIQTIARTFIKTLTELESDQTDLTKAQAADALAAYYHLVQPSTEAACYTRWLIEEAFKVLDLGPIPPATHTQALHTETEREFRR